LTQSKPTNCVLLVLNGQSQGKRLEWDGVASLTLGREPTADLVIDDDHVSSQHLALAMSELPTVKELGSRNGTTLLRGDNVLQVTEAGLTLEDGDRLLVGDQRSPVVVVFYASPESEQRAEEARVVASAHIGELKELERRVGEDHSTLRLLYAGLKQLSRRLEFVDIVATGVELIFQICPSATHVTLMVENELMAGDLSSRFVPVLSMGRDGVAETPRTPSRWLRKKILEEGSALLASDATTTLDGSKSLRLAAIDSMIAAPLWVGDRITGILQIEKRNAASVGISNRPFGQKDLERALVVASHLAISIEHSRLYGKLRANAERLKGENRFLKQKDAESTLGMIGSSPSMAQVFALIEKVKDVTIPVCIEGETGTGKELVARAIHYRSSRREELFVAQNCAAMPEDLLESELFGHTRGSFTGADTDKKGLFEIAHGGTIFLDEIGETTPAMQVKLLRVLQEGEIRPVGSVKTKKIDVRVISATNRNLEEEVAAGRFREDLYYRLNVFPLRLPPLRDRKADINALIEHFMHRYALEFGRAPLTFDDEAMDMMVSYHWPGNIRELQNEVQRVIICGSEGGQIGAKDLSNRIRKIDQLLDNAKDTGGTLKDRLAQVERYLLIETLREYGNNKTKAAVALGITREGLHKKLARCGIQ